MINTQCSFRAAVSTSLTFAGHTLPCTKSLPESFRFCCIAPRDAVVFMWKSAVKTSSFDRLGIWTLFAEASTSYCEGPGGMHKPEKLPGPWFFLPLPGERDLFLLLTSLVLALLWQNLPGYFYK